MTEEYLRKKPAAAPGAPVRGDLSSSSIFEDEEIAGPKPTRENVAAEDIPRNPDTMAAALDPDPMSRKRWERKMVIRDITKRGRLTRAQLLKKEERVVQIRSHDFKTSVKKLLPLAKQITGKTVEDAIIQMRFSKKKAAKDVKEHLEYTKNQAIVRRGMGLGVGVEEGKFHPKQIMTKHGKRIKVTDPTRMYVDQAWVGRGPFGRTPEFRKGGRVNIMMNPWTCMCFPTFLRAHLANKPSFDSCTQGRKDTDPSARGAGGEGGETQSLGTVAKQTDHCSTTILFLVESLYQHVNYCLYHT